MNDGVSAHNPKCLLRLLTSQNLIQLQRYLILCKLRSDRLVRRDIQPEFNSVLQRQISELLIFGGWSLALARVKKFVQFETTIEDLLSDQSPSCTQD